jgi:ABC-2 type transport system permease protein
MVLGKTLGSATLAWTQGLIFLAFAPLAGYRPGMIQLSQAIGVVFVISLTFTLLGFLIAWQTDSSQGFHAVMNLLLVPLWMISGALFSSSGAHVWIRALMAVNPLTYSLALMRRALAPAEMSGAPGLAASLLVSGATVAALLAACTFVANRKPNRSPA